MRFKDAAVWIAGKIAGSSLPMKSSGFEAGAMGIQRIGFGVIRMSYSKDIFNVLDFYGNVYDLIRAKKEPLAPIFLSLCFAIRILIFIDGLGNFLK